MDVKKIGGFIAALRKERGLTQKELAERLGVSDRAVSKWERGLNLPDAALFEPLCRELGISVVELLRGEREAVTLPQMEQVLTDAVTLAEEREAESRLLRRIFFTVTLILLLVIAGVLLGYSYEARREQVQQEYYDSNQSLPKVIDLTYRYSRGIAIGHHFTPAGHRYLNSAGDLLERDLLVNLQDTSDVLRRIHEYCVEENYPTMTFEVDRQKTGMTMDVVRWPAEAIGTGIGLEGSQPAEFFPAPDRTANPDLYYLVVEAGYLYSILFSWGDGYFVEYSFLTLEP